MFKIRNLTVTRSNKVLLDQVSFDIPAGQLSIILGPNGAGKSTLLKTIAGTIKADIGSIWFEEKEINQWPLNELAKRRAVLTQQIHIPFSLNVAEVVALGLAPWQLTKQAASDLISFVLSELDMQGTEDRNYLSLSGGEQQRIQMARVLVQVLANPANHEETFLMLDEPISALDLHQQQRVLRLLKKLADQGIGILCILHDINLATLFGDKIIVLQQGKMIYNDTPKELAQNSILERTYQADLVKLTHTDNQLPQWLFRV